MAESRFPHPLTLLTACILVSALCSYILPAGEYQRRDDPVTSRKVVVAGTYHRIEPYHVGPFEALVAIPKGMSDAASVIFLVFLVGGAFTVVDETGALRRGVGWLVRRLERRESLVIPIVSLTFATGGALENLSEEIIALVPVLLLVTRRLGFDALTAVAISVGAAAVGSAFSPINPFQAQIAQKLAGLAAPLRRRLPPAGDGGGAGHLDLGMLAPCGPRAAAAGGDGPARRRPRRAARPPPRQRPRARARDLRRFIFGVMRLGWDFDQMSALFFAMGVLAGLAGGLGIDGTARGFVTGSPRWPTPRC